MLGAFTEIIAANWTDEERAQAFEQANAEYVAHGLATFTAFTRGLGDGLTQPGPDAQFGRKEDDR